MTTLLTLLLPEPLVLPAALGLASAFGVDERSVQFLEREYIPEIQRALGKKSLNLVKKSKLFSYTLRMIKKMVFAFKFQERTFPIALLTSPLVNQVQILHNSNSGLIHKFNFSDRRHSAVPSQYKVRIPDSFLQGNIREASQRNRYEIFLRICSKGLSIYYVSSYNKAGSVGMLTNAYLREQGFIQKLMSYVNPH